MQDACEQTESDIFEGQCENTFSTGEGVSTGECNDEIGVEGEVKFCDGLKECLIKFGPFNSDRGENEDVDEGDEYDEEDGKEDDNNEVDTEGLAVAFLPTLELDSTCLWLENDGS